MSVLRITLLVEEVTTLGRTGAEVDRRDVGLVSVDNYDNDAKNMIGRMLDDVVYDLKTAGGDEL